MTQSAFSKVSGFNKDYFFPGVFFSVMTTTTSKHFNERWSILLVWRSKLRKCYRKI